MQNKIEGVLYIARFITEEQENAVKDSLKDEVWDESMKSRKTMSFGAPYNYNQMKYEARAMPDSIYDISEQIEELLNFLPSNCLINLYSNGKSKLGYHSDQIDILAEGTGVAIVSIGVTRTFRFKNTQDPTLIVDFELESGSLLYMTQEVQKEWQHCIPVSDVTEERMSLTFRLMADVDIRGVNLS